MKIGAKVRMWVLTVLVTVIYPTIPTIAELPPFKVFTTEEGLAHDSVNKIVRDSRGFLWFCTAEGLSRFDGTRFTNFTQDQGLPHRNVFDLLETHDGTFLIATSAGVSVFDPKGKAYRWNVIESRLEQTANDAPLFQTFAPDVDDRQKRGVNSLAEDAAGTIWASTPTALYRLVSDGTTWKFEIVEDFVKNRDSIQKLFIDSKGTMVAGGAAGVYQASTDGTFRRILDRGTAEIMEDRDGALWLDSGTAPIGLQVFSRGPDGDLSLIKRYTKKDGLPGDAFFFALRQTVDGRIFVGMHDGLCEFVPDAKDGSPKFRQLSHEKVTSFGEDTGGSLWIGTELFGAWRLAPNDFTIFGEADGFTPTDDIRAIGFDTAGNIFLPSRPNSTIVADNGKFRSIVPKGLGKRSWSWHYLDLLSKDGEWWIPSANGLFHYPRVANVRDLERTPPKRIFTTADGLTGNEIFNIFEDSRGDIWITSVGQEFSLNRWDRKTDTIIPTTAADGLPRVNGPISFAEDRQGNVWLGHYFGNLSRYHDGKFQVFGEKDGLPQTQIADLLVDQGGQLWIGTSGRGLFVVRDPAADNPVFTSISTLNGLSSNQIICLTQDTDRRIYAGTGRGINRIDDRGTIKVFSKADGLPSNYITRCSSDAKGYLWFISRNTLIRFLPKIERPTPPPPVFIDRILVNGVPQSVSVMGESRIELAELAPDQKQMQISFFALAFGSGESVRYQYSLDEQTSWSDPSDQQSINLNLSSGSHTLNLRAIGSDNVASNTPATLAFRILPPIYARWWFIALAIFVSSGTLLAFYRYRTARLREVNLASENARSAEERLRRSREERIVELEDVRSRIATDLHDDIGASLTQIAILSEVAQTTSGHREGDARSPLAKITDISNELVSTMSDIVWSINPSKDHLSDLTQRMRRFASDVLSAGGIRVRFLTSDDDGKIVLSTNVRREVFLIFKESVNNIAKHSGAKSVEIHLTITGHEMDLWIADDGHGFPVRSVTDDDAGLSAETAGNGLKSMSRRAREMNGHFDITSEMGKGTTVTLTLPLDAAGRH